MQAGHGGKSGRFQRYREIAMEYAFLLDEAKKSAASGGSFIAAPRSTRGREN
jgi:hypothetical protein